MAKLFLESTDTAYKVSNSGTTIYGATGDQTVTIDGSLTGIVLDSNVERVAFSGTTSDYKYKQVGTDLEVYNAAGALVTKFGFDFDKGGKLTFANGTVDAKFAPATGLTVGGQTVSTTAAAAVVPTTIDATVSSAPAPVFSVSAPITSVTEAAGAVASFTVSLNAAQPAATSVAFALGNVGGATTDDYGTAALGAAAGGVTLAGSVLTFAAGSTSAVITVPVTNDSLVETTGDGVSLTLSAPSTGATVGTAAATVSIVDGVPATPTFSLTASATSAAEGTPVNGATAAVASGTITLTVTRAGALTATDSVVIQSANGTGVSGATTSDFTAVSQTLTFLPNEATKTVTFTPVADSTRESDETLTVSLGSASAGSAISTTGNTVTLTITNDDPNLLPVLTVPTATPSAFIGLTTPVKGISFADGDDNVGFTVTVQAAGSSQVSYSEQLGSSSVSAKNSTGAVVYTNETSNTIVFTGTKANLNTVLDSIRYTTNSSVPTSEQITITITDAAGGVATKTLPINIGTSGALTGNSDSLLGSAGDDIFSGVLSDFVASDTLAGGTGTDKLTLTDIGTSGTLPTLTTKATGIDILDLVAVSSNGGSAVSTLAVFNAVDFGSTLMTVNFTAGNSSGTTAGDANDTLTATTANTGTVFNIQNTMGTLTVGGINGTPTATDAFTVNLAGGTAVTTIADGGTNVIDVLNINSNGTSANSVGFIDVDANTTINVAGSQALTISNTLPALAAIKFNAASATGKITVAAGESAASIIGGSAGDVITGGNGLDTISGGAGNDTINGGAAADLITGGTGADSLTGGAGFDTFVFAVGDSPATGRDTIADLAEGDIIKFGTALTGLTNGATLTTSSTNTIYVDNVNNRLVVGTDSINIPPSVANAAFTYSYGADSVVGTADDTITVGAAPFVATNNAGGVLTLTGKAISTVIVDMDNLGLAPKVNSAITGNNQVSKLDASLVTSSGVNVTGSARADTIIGSAENDTITGGAGSDIITGGAGGDSISFSESPTAVDTLVINAGDTWNGASVVDTVTVLTGIDKISGFASGDKIQLVAATGTSPVFNKGSLGVDNKWTNNSSGADSILIYDADGSGTGTNQDAIVLIGYTTGTNGAITGNTITLS